MLPASLNQNMLFTSFDTLSSVCVPVISNSIIRVSGNASWCNVFFELSVAAYTTACLNYDDAVLSVIVKYKMRRKLL